MKTNRKDAQIAEPQKNNKEGTTEAGTDLNKAGTETEAATQTHKEKCSLQSVQNAEGRLMFPLNQPETDRFTARIAINQEDGINRRYPCTGAECHDNALSLCAFARKSTLIE